MRNYFSVPVSSMEGGVNRFETEASRDQAADALNVINDGGYLRRRDSFTSVVSGVPHHMPKGAVFVMTSDAAGIGEGNEETVTDLRDGYGTISGGSIKRLYIGTPERFDGISWGIIDTVTDTLSASISLNLYYHATATATNWSSVPSFKDKTRARVGNYLSSLCQNGDISWHSGDLTNWTPIAPTGLKAATGFTSAYLGDITTLYWIRIDFVTTAGTATSIPTGDVGLVTVKPGVRAFQLQPVNGLFPVRLADRQVIVVCNDRGRTGGSSNLRAHEPGSQIGIIHNANGSTNILRLVQDEGLGTYGRIEWSAWTTSGSTAGSGTSSYLGTAGELEKADQSYAWLYDSTSTEPRFGQFRGAPLVEGLVPQTTSSTKIVKFLSSVIAPQANEFDHCRLRFTDVTGSSGSGNVLGHDREIWRTYTSGLYTYVQVHDEFLATPHANDRFAIISPNARALVAPMGGVAEDLEVSTHDTGSAHKLIVASDKYAQAPSGSITNKIVNFELSNECRWGIDSGRRYSGTYSRATKKLILTNGKGPLLEIDGHRLRTLTADTTSTTAKAIAGELREKEDEEETEFSLHAKTFLRDKPPRGDIVVDYRGRIVVARIETNEISYNWPGKPDVWPVGYQFQIRDAENNPITGMATLYDKLVIYTSTAIFDCGPPNAAGYFTVRPASQGIGFTSHWAVQRISTRGSSGLIGPGTDGVYFYNGAEPVVVLDDWERLIQGGVNRGRLDDAVAAVSFTKNLYFLAVAAHGSETNNRVLVFDFARKNWWVWSSPHGISFMATDYDESGKEQILFGTNDGHVQILNDSLSDDGHTIAGHATTVPVSPSGDRESSFIAALGSYGDLGSSDSGVNSVTLKTFADRKEEADTSASVKLDGGRVSADVDSWDAATLKKWGDDRFLRKRTNLPPGTKGNMVSVQVSGTDRWKLRDLTLMARRLARRGR